MVDCLPVAICSTFVSCYWGISILIIPTSPFTPRVSYEDIKVVLSFKSVYEIHWCDHTNDTLSAVLLHGTTYTFKSFLQNKIWDLS